MSLTVQAAADVAGLLASGEVGEPLLVGSDTVTCLFGDVQVADLQSGWCADVAEAHVPLSGLSVLPTRGQSVTRQSDLTDWTIDAVRGGPVWCVLTLTRNHRPYPRGP